MHRFYFDFRQEGKLSADEEGCDFASAEEAYLEAYKAAQEMWSGLLAERRDPRRCSFEVRDDHGRLLFVLPFTELLESCQENRKSPLPLMVAAQLNLDRARRLKAEFGREVEMARKQLLQMHHFLSVL